MILSPILSAVDVHHIIVPAGSRQVRASYSEGRLLPPSLQVASAGITFV